MIEKKKKDKETEKREKEEVEDEGMDEQCSVNVCMTAGQGERRKITAMENGNMVVLIDNDASATSRKGEMIGNKMYVTLGSGYAGKTNAEYSEICRSVLLDV